MDIIALSKASKVLKQIKQLDESIIAPLAESRFPTVDARLDWMEGQANQLLVEGSKQLDLSKGTFTNAELVDGKIQLKKLGEVGSGYMPNAIPAMTSNTLPSGTVDSIDNDSTAYKAFDLIDTSYASIGTGTPTDANPAWVSYQFAEAKRIQKYKITAYTDTDAARPKSWLFQGSNDDGMTWNVLDTFDGSTTYGSGIEREFQNSVSYKTYRLFVTSIYGTNAYFRVSELEMMESAIQTTYTSSGTYESPVIDLGEGWRETKLVDVVKQIANGGYTENVIPTMTSNTAPSPSAVISSGDYSTSYAAWKAFNKSNASNADSWYGTAQNDATKAWHIGINFGSGITKKITKYSITSSMEATWGTRAPATWFFQGSNDNSIWVNLDSRTDEPAWLSNRKREYTFANTDSYQYYRLAISKSGGDVNYVSVGELEMMESLPGTNCTINISTSVDGLSFSEYTTLDLENLTQARYVKIRATLTAKEQPGEVKDLEFDQAGENKVILNDFTVANGDLKLKNAYTVTDDTPVAEGNGFVYELPIQKSIFKKIHSLEVN